jgi:hypothetical protein
LYIPQFGQSSLLLGMVVGDGLAFLFGVFVFGECVRRKK